MSRITIEAIFVVFFSSTAAISILMGLYVALGDLKCERENNVYDCKMVLYWEPVQQ